MGTKNKNFWGNLLVIVIILIVIGYSIFNFRVFIAGPDLIIKNPINGAVVDTNLINLEGQALNINKISLNNRHIFIDENGNFSEKVLLQPGYNIILLEAQDQFDRKVQKKLALNYTGDRHQIDMTSVMLESTSTLEDAEGDLETTAPTSSTSTNSLE